MRLALAVVVGVLSILPVGGDLYCADAVPDSQPAAVVPTVPFVDLRLDENGLRAVDSLGTEWFYDFERDAFVLRPPGDDEAVDGEIAGLGEGEPARPVQERCTELRRVKQFERRSLTIGYDEYVEGNIVVWGRVTVKGWVKGSVKSFNKRVLVTETGRVEGDVEAPEVVVKEGAFVGGRVIEEPVPLDIEDIAAPFSATPIVVVGGLTVVLLIGSFLLTSLAPRQVTSVAECVLTQKGKSFFVGVLMVLLMPLIVLLVVITIIGVVVVPLVPVAYLLAIVLGMISVGMSIGRGTTEAIRTADRGLTGPALLGIILLMIPWAGTTLLLGMSDEVGHGLGVALLVVSILLTCFPVFAGIGASVLTRFGYRSCARGDRSRPGAGRRAPAPAPPPIPEPPRPSDDYRWPEPRATSADEERNQG